MEYRFSEEENKSSFGHTEFQMTGELTFGDF